MSSISMAYHIPIHSLEMQTSVTNASNLMNKLIKILLQFTFSSMTMEKLKLILKLENGRICEEYNEKQYAPNQDLC